MQDPDFVEQDLPMDILEASLSLVAGAKHVGLAGGGEPMAHRQFPEFCRLIKDYNPDVSLGMTTNLLLLDTERAQAIRNYLGDCQVSYDGVISYPYFRINRAGDGVPVEDIERKIMMLMDAVEGSGVTVGMAMVVTNRNMEEIPDTVRRAHELGFGNVMGMMVQDHNKEMEGESPWENLSRLQEIVRETRLLADELDIGFSMNADIGDGEHRSCYTWEDETYVPCCHPWFIAQVRIDGHLNACCSGPKTEWSLHDHDAMDIWMNDPVLKDMREHLSDGVFPECCQGCYKTQKGAVQHL
jgi:MoaA/NifB/PqqE/SkfB family radical SAM enzyme